MRSARLDITNTTHVRPQPSLSIGLAVIVLCLTVSGVQAQTSFYWNGASTSANPANGGTGTWSTTNAWRTGSSVGTQGTWAAATNGTNAGFLAGSAGTITLGTTGSTNFTGSSLTVQTTGYIVTSTSTSRNLVMTGALSLDSSVGLTLDLNNTNGNWGFGRVTGASGSSLTLSGIATASNANRVSLSTASGTSNAPAITLSGTAAGPTGFVATAASHTLSSNIANNSSTSATMLGATSNNSLTYSGVLSGSAHLQVSAGNAGGAGSVTLSGANTFSGDTYTNNASNGVLRIGANNVLPSTTNVFMGQSAGGGTADAGGSIDLNGFNLAVASLTAASSTRGVANNTTTLSTLTIGKASGTATFAGVIGTVSSTALLSQSNAIALVKTGGSTQILNAANTYTGATTISGGTLALGASGSLASPTISVASGGWFDVTAKTGFSVGTGQQLGGLGTILGNLEFGSGSTLAFDATGPMLIGSGTLSFASGFGIDDLVGLSNATPDATYTVFSQTTGGSIDVANLANLGAGAAYDLGGKSAYFTTGVGTLSVIVVPEPSTLGLAAAGLVLAGLCVRKRPRRSRAA